MKILTIYPVPVYVGEKSCNKTHFDLFNTVWKVFPRFFVVLSIWRDTVLRLLCFGKELEVQEMTGRLLHVG